ncbi:MAG: tetratricopeptide repeat protein [Xanthomonadales bacterium]|nr:tetratricopeptide repeat protein [Xanthomonadales bacterium]
MSPERCTYRAFISYSHKDSGFARWLHRKLENYRVPKNLQADRAAKSALQPLRPIFLDRDELASAASLSDSIVQALNASAALIVICSPAAAASRWANEEILHFRRAFPERPVFAIVAWGNPGVDPRIDAEHAAIPLSLLLADVDVPDGKLGEPLAVDVRREGDGKQAAFLKLVAGLLAVPYDQLRQRELRRRNQIRSVAFGISLALTATFAFMAWRATVARNEARAARAQAELELLSERQTRDFLLSVFQLADPGEARGEAVTVREVLDTAVARIDSTEFARPLIRSRFLATMGQAYSSLGMNRRSVELLQQSLDSLSTDSLSVESQLQRIDSLLELADVWFDMGDYRAATASLDKASSGEAARQITSLQMAYALNIRGDVLSYQDQDKAADEAFRASLQMLKSATPTVEEAAYSRSRSLGGLAVLQQLAGDYNKSLTSYAEVVNILLPVFGERHPDTIWGMVSWGSAAYSAGDTGTAKKAWQQSAAIAREVLGESHPEVGTIKNNLGRLLFESGEYQQAEVYLREALAIDRAHRKADFDDLAFTLNNLALALLAQEHHEEAQALREEAQALREEAQALREEAQTLLEEAQTLLEEALAIAESSGHRMLGPIMASLADLNCQLGQHQAGSDLASRAMVITVDEYGADDWHSKRALLIGQYCEYLNTGEFDASAMNAASLAIADRWGEQHYFSQRALEQVGLVSSP